MKQAEVEHNRQDAAALRENAEVNHRLAAEKIAEVEALKAQLQRMKIQADPRPQDEMLRKEVEGRDTVIKGLQETVHGYEIKLAEVEKECIELKEVLAMVEAVAGVNLGSGMDGASKPAGLWEEEEGGGQVSEDAMKHENPGWWETPSTPFTVSAASEGAKSSKMSDAEREWEFQKSHHGESNEVLDFLMIKMSGAQAVKSYFMKVKAQVDLLKRQGGDLKTENFNLLVSPLKPFLGILLIL